MEQQAPFVECSLCARHWAQQVEWIYFSVKPHSILRRRVCHLPFCELGLESFPVEVESFHVGENEEDL